MEQCISFWVVVSKVIVEPRLRTKLAEQAFVLLVWLPGIRFRLNFMLHETDEPLATMLRENL